MESIEKMKLRSAGAFHYLVPSAARDLRLFLIPSAARDLLFFLIPSNARDLCARGADRCSLRAQLSADV